MKFRQRTQTVRGGVENCWKVVVWKTAEDLMDLGGWCLVACLWVSSVESCGSFRIYDTECVCFLCFQLCL
jgi:hypothetical protein